MSRSRPREADLAHGAPDGRFAEAVAKCEGYTPDCIYVGRCRFDGRCFASPANLVAARMIEGLFPKGAERQHIRGMHWALLEKVAQMLRDDAVGL